MPSGSGGTRAGLAEGQAYCLPEVAVIGEAVSRVVEQQRPNVEKLQLQLSARLQVNSPPPSGGG